MYILKDIEMYNRTDKIECIYDAWVGYVTTPCPGCYIA